MLKKGTKGKPGVKGKVKEGMYIKSVLSCTYHSSVLVSGPWQELGIWFLSIKVKS